jgi:hypothetical protein
MERVVNHIPSIEAQISDYILGFTVNLGMFIKHNLMKPLPHLTKALINIHEAWFITVKYVKAYWQWKNYISGKEIVT